MLRTFGERCSLGMKEYEIKECDASESNSTLAGKEFSRNVSSTIVPLPLRSPGTKAYTHPEDGACHTSCTGVTCLGSTSARNSYKRASDPLVVPLVLGPRSVTVAIAIAADTVCNVIPFGATDSPGIYYLPNSPVPSSFADADHGPNRGLYLLAYQVLL